MLRPLVLPRHTSRGPGALPLLGAAAVAVGLLFLTACDDKSDAPAPQDQAPAGGADLFGGMDAQRKGPPPGPPPEGDAAGQQGPGSSAEPPLVPVLDPAVATECKTLKEQEAGLRAQADEIREKRVSPAAEAYENAFSAYNACQEDFGCSNNEGRYNAMAANAQKAEAAMNKEEEALMKVEGELHDVSEKIAAKCGDF